MSVGADIWRLPGPAAFVDDIAGSISGGRHVVAVLPRYLAADAERSDALAVAVLEKVPHAQRVLPWAGDGPLVEALARQVTYADDYPVTVPDLIRHSDVQGNTYVFLLADLENEHIHQVPEFLRRLQTDSRSVPTGERCSFVVITDRSGLPLFAGNEHSDVTLANCWYWNRISRWDVAAHLAAQSAATTETGVLREVRTETIIELARWDFDLASRLASSWTGNRADLVAVCEATNECLPVLQVSGRLGNRPPEALLEAWESGLVDGWHEAICLAPSRRLDHVADLNRHMWSGQARVLLPWIEIKRDRLEASACKVVGQERFHRALRQFATRPFDPCSPEDVAEIGLLHSVIHSLLRDEPKMRAAARALRDARNKLAHLRPLAPAQLDELVRACAFLRG